MGQCSYSTDSVYLVILSVYIELNLRASSFSKTMCMLAKRFIACGEKRRVCFSDPTLLPECSHHYVCMYKKNFLSYNVILNKYTAVYLCILNILFSVYIQTVHTLYSYQKIFSFESPIPKISKKAHIMRFLEIFRENGVWILIICSSLSM